MSNPNTKRFGVLTGESLDLVVGRRLRRRLGSTAGCRWASPPFCLVLVVVVNSPLGGLASVPAFALLRPPHSDCMGRRLADALPPFCSLADTLLPFGRGGCFAAGFVLLFRRMLFRLVGRVDALPPLVVLATFASYGL